MIRRQLINFQNRSVDVRVGFGAFDELSRMFSSAVGKPKRAMVMITCARSTLLPWLLLWMPASD